MNLLHAFAGFLLVTAGALLLVLYVFRFEGFPNITAITGIVLSAVGVKILWQYVYIKGISTRAKHTTL
jgi:hypothetical protein